MQILQCKDAHGKDFRLTLTINETVKKYCAILQSLNYIINQSCAEVTICKVTDILGSNWARVENSGRNSLRCFRLRWENDSSCADLPWTLMHSPSLGCSVVALGLLYLTVIEFCRGEHSGLWLVGGKVNWKCTLLVMSFDALIWRNSLTHSFWVFFSSVQ